MTEDEALEKEKLRDRKCKTIGNYVHESVPVNDNEVRVVRPQLVFGVLTPETGLQRDRQDLGSRGRHRREEELSLTPRGHDEGGGV